MDAHLRWLPLLAVGALGADALAQVQRTPDEALRLLQDGNQRFVAGTPAVKPTGPGVRRTLARGDSPLAVVVACAETAAPPEFVFDAAHGDLVVVRTAGHVLSPELIAAVELAAEQQAVSLCVVLAHDGCSTVARALAQADAAPAQADCGSAGAHVLTACEPAVRAARASGLVGPHRLRCAEEEHAHDVVHGLLRHSPLLGKRAAEGRFRIVAARCQQTTGVVDWLPARPLPQDPAMAAAAVRQAPPNAPPHVALRALQAGHRRSLGDGQPTGDTSATRRAQLAAGVPPLAVVLACSDARQAPERVFDAGLGELVVVRLPGTALTDDALAAVEAAVIVHGTPLFVVLGHTGCHALRTAADGSAAAHLTPSQRTLTQRLEAAVTAARHDGGAGELLDRAARGQALRTLAEARARSAVLRAAERDGKLLALAAQHDLATGDIAWLAEPPAQPAPAVAAGAGHDGHGAPKPAAPAAASEHGHGAAHGHAQDHGHGAAHGHGDGHAAPAAPTATPHHDANAHGETAAPAHQAAAGHALPVVDWAAMPSMPLGETAPATAAAVATPTATPWWHLPAWLAAGGGTLALVAGELLLRRRRG